MDKLRDGRKSSPQRIVVGIDGATGIIYGLRALQILREIGIETHLVVSHAGDMIREDETPLSRGDLYALADVVHPETDVGASIASDVYQALGMLIAPCSVRTVGELASGVPLTLLAGRGRGPEGAPSGDDGSRGTAAQRSHPRHARGHREWSNNSPARSGVLY
jgi:Flavoprotein